MDIETLNLARKYADKLVQGKGAIQGEDGASAYEQAVEGGYTGTLAEFESSLAAWGETMAQEEMLEILNGGAD